MLSGGTHGSIKHYRYLKSKYALQKAVEDVIASNHSVIKDPIAGYYNDGEKYVTIAIKQPDMTYRYTFRYYGDSALWKASPEFSELFICYARDQYGNGGSEGNGKVTWYHPKLKKRLIKPFETEFISRLDSVLQTSHITPD
jgi:hypothetical protein